MSSSSNLVNHVAVLVPSVEKAATAFEPLGFQIGPVEEWESEGTREIYVGDSATQSSLLLLMEPLKAGAYRRAMEKRGPGLHHLAIDVLDLASFVDGLTGTGWYLHPRSLHTVKKTQTAYLARPGMPMLIEVQQRTEIKKEPSLIEQIEIPLGGREFEMLKALGLHQVTPSKSGESWLHFANDRVSFKDLY